MGTKHIKALNELASAKLLASCGVNMVRSVLIRERSAGVFQSVEEAIGFPMVMKIVSEDILHKTDAGCVVLDIKSPEAMQEAYDTILKNAAEHAPDARIEGVVAQQMLPKGFEVLLGVSTDAQFGHVIMVGLGGIYVELLKAVSLRVLPITREDALDMINETPLRKACEGLRGVQYDREEIIGALMSLSKLIEEHPEITEIDVNPFVMFGQGRPATAVDAVVICSEA